MKPALVLYVPVLHRGYDEILQAHQQRVSGLYIVGRSLAKEHAFLEREIRALAPRTVEHLATGLYRFRNVCVLGRKTAARLNGKPIITADEALTRRVASRYFPASHITFIQSFLRWDERHVDTKVPAETDYDRISNSPADREWMYQALVEAEDSSCWWRHVGAIIPIDQNALAGCNTHMPSEYAPYAHGDIRDFILAGSKSDVSSSIHAEKLIIAQAARRGIPLDGSSIYVTTFPCSDCARVIAHAGIRHCYFGGGHASFDGARILRAFGVELVYVPKTKKPAAR